MKKTELIMGMPITIEVVDSIVTENDIVSIFDYFRYIDETFSTYKETSEITAINKGRLQLENASSDMQLIFTLAEETRKATNGYFDIKRADGTYEPAGIVKGWSIYKASQLLKDKGLYNFYIDAGGDIQVSGKNQEGTIWRTGIRNPFNRNEIVKALAIENKGVATSGTYIRGQHIYNPLQREEALTDIVSITIVGENIYEADRFATAAFAMGREGIVFIENLPCFEGYMINKDGIATFTSGFSVYVLESVDSAKKSLFYKDSEYI